MANSTKLHVGNLPPNCTNREVRDLCSRFGKIVECKMMQGYAFVHFTEKKYAILAVTQLNNTEWNGNILRVKSSYSDTKLFVGNLPNTCSEDSVRELFAKIGKVEACSIIKGYAFVHFVNRSDALDALEILNDMKWNGSILKVQPSHSKVHLKPRRNSRGECFICGKTGHLRRDCPQAPAQDIESSNTQEKASTALRNLYREVNAMNGNFGDRYSFINKYGDSDNDSLEYNHPQTSYPKYALRNEYNSDQNSRDYYSNCDDYDRDMYTSSIKRSSYSNYPPPSTTPSHYRQQPYPTSNERRLAVSSSSMSDRHRLSSSSASRSLSSHPGSNSNNHYKNPFDRPPPEYYEHRRCRPVDHSSFSPSREQH